MAEHDADKPINHPTDDPSRMQGIRVQCGVCKDWHLLWVRPYDWTKFGHPHGPHIQDCFPYLSAAERELMMSRNCGDCWDRMWAPPFESFTERDKVIESLLPTWVRKKAEAHGDRFKDVTWCRFSGESTFYAYREGKWVGQLDLFDV